MNNNKRHTTIPSRGELQGFVGEVHTYHVDPAILIEKYGKPIRPWRRGWRG